VRRLWKVLAVVAAVLVATVSAVTMASASGDRTTVLHLTTENAQATNLDLGKKGPSQGDEFIVADNVFMSGNRVGTLAAVCTLTRLAAQEEAQCIFTIGLPRGQITGQFLLVGGSFDNATFAITGGTGAYRDAGGSGKATMGGNTLTLFVKHLAA
jgi:hypothetical protein